MKIDLIRNSRTPLFIQIKNQIRSRIIAKTLPEGYRLPSERVLAEQLDVHRNTIIKAYKALVMKIMYLFIEIRGVILLRVNLPI